MLLRAPIILGEDGILKDHAIWVEGERIREIAPQKSLGGGGEALDFPETILFPGLVNAHCHLELSQLPEPLPYPGSFVGWIEELGRLKLQMTPEKTAAAIRLGIEKSLQSGTTTIADHISAGTSPQTLMDSVLEGVIYAEVLGVEPVRAAHFYEEAEKLKVKTENKNLKFKIVPTPHAPYSLLPEFFSALVADGTTHETQRTPLSIHIAESIEEYLLFKERSGPLAEFLAAKGKLPPTIGETPFQYMQRLRLLPKNAMAIHANYLEEGDISILQNANTSVVHCPGSHAYFGHDRFPLGMLEEAGVNIALGTDSLASNESLNMFQQMRLALETYAELTPETALKMATLNGARALRRAHEIGSLKEGKLANILGVPFRFPKQTPHENILLSDGPKFVMCRGNVIKIRRL